MQVITCESHAKKQVQRTIRAIVLLVILTLPIGLLVHLVGGRLMVLPLIAFLFCIVLGGLSTIRPWIKGDLGESRAVESILHLPDDFTLIRNWKIPNAVGGDSDLIVLGPHGVLVVEVKTYKAVYECYGDHWYNVKPNGFKQKIKSPSIQIKQNVVAVKRYLRHRGWTGPVKCVLAIAPRSKVTIFSSHVDIIEWSNLAKYIHHLPHSRLIPPASLFEMNV